MDFPPRPPRQGPTEPRAPRERPSRRRGLRRPAPGGPERASRRRPRRETMARIGVAVPWIVLAILVIAVGGLPFALAMIAFAGIGLGELFRMTRRYRPL